MFRWGAPPIRIRRGIFPACVSVAAATAITWPISDALDQAVYPFYFFAVLVVAWTGGPAAGVLAIALSAFAANFFFRDPTYELHFHGNDGVRAGAFAVVSLMIIAADHVRRRAETARRAADERLRQALEAGEMGSWEWDVETNRVTWSTELEGLHGLESGTFGGDFSSFLKDIHPEDRQRVQEIIAHSLETGDHLIEYRIIRPDGSVRWVEGRGKLERNEDGTPRRMAGVCMDVTERKQAEEALRDSEERYRTLYQDNPSMYFTVNAEGTVLSVNQFGAGQLRHTPEELVGKPVLDVFHKDDKTAVAEQLALCVARPGEMANWEFRKVRKDGEVIYVKEAARATLDANGETIVLIVCEDITERKRVEEELQKAREELEAKVERHMHQGRAYGLTFRELTVLHLIAEGNSDREIAGKLSLSRFTVGKHVANIRSKMGVSSRSEASARAIRESLVA